MRIIVLGAAAGGGFPQWNCGCRNCRRARSNDPAATPRTQCGLAVSGDGRQWVLINASPDLRQQLLDCPDLHPGPGARGSPVTAVVLSSAEIDAVAGLLTLREGHRFALHASPAVLDALAANPVFDCLHPNSVSRHPIGGDDVIAMPDLDRPISISMFSVPGKVPLYLETDDAIQAIGAETGQTVGIALRDGDRSAFFIPGCARLTEDLANRLRGADLLMFDGTLWTDDEMIRLGLGAKTGARMGHMSIDGPDGSLALLGDLDIKRKIFIHINNSNPVLMDDSPERAVATAAGWEVAHDGMEIVL